MGGGGMRKRRVLVLMHEDSIPPDSLDGFPDKEIVGWKTEYDVVHTLKDLGHGVRPLGLRSDLGVLREAIVDWKPHVAFNLLEEFHDVGVYDQHVASYLELMRQPYTGCNPRGLMLTHDKALCKKILTYHRIRTPRFAVFPKGRSIQEPKRLAYPLFVKSLIEEGSVGIAQASVVHSFEKLKERVEFLHAEHLTHAIAEEYIEGRELYVAILGNRRLNALPIVELDFGDLSDGGAPIATSRVKWDWKYQEKHNIKINVVKDLSSEVERKVIRICKRIYRILSLSGYARIDLRLDAEGKIYVLEANPNADLAFGEEFAEAAKEDGISYEQLLQRVLTLGLNYQAEWRMV